MGESSLDKRTIDKMLMQQCSWPCMLKAMKENEAIEKYDKEQVSRNSRCLHTILQAKDKFDGKNVTKYLKIYLTRIEIQRKDEGSSANEFFTLVEPEVRSLVIIVPNKVINDSRGVW